ncbi:SPX domain protein involved in polyphosphate accumulation [Desulfobaculum xiamenense]|uniref:SPX domain protein involved in polyphosphate accumulation n=1 Tax=Desulfobaculum xiamenense TaxID=995050 RepID=A0A846QJP5_9BACT|nr:polyphosphate polymerase domain-containing protein [Desulfobaculum xiamenense]NJB66702.1 SPX domain protein involved in polyphosphate accumulation [Desulfobaculum xiamenense]
MIDRIEYKYYVPAWMIPAIIADLEKFCIHDEHATREDHAYRVASVYFDDMGMRAYHQKLSGLPHRTKVRVRFYPDCGSDACFLEFKHKVADRIRKRKTRVDGIEDVLDAVQGGTKDWLLENVHALARHSGLKPIVRIDYDRIAMASKTDSQVRITLDTAIRCARVDNELRETPRIPVTPEDVGILEIKSPSYIPFFASMIIGKYRLQRRAISKYGNAIQNLSLNSAFTF